MLSGLSENLSPDGVVELAGPDRVHPLGHKGADHEPVRGVELVDNGAAVDGAQRKLLVLRGNRDDLIMILQHGPEAVTLPGQRLYQGHGVGRHAIGIAQHGLQHVSRQA